MVGGVGCYCGGWGGVGCAKQCMAGIAHSLCVYVCTCRILRSM